jgi:hypothetical protein
MINSFYNVLKFWIKWENSKHHTVGTVVQSYQKIVETDKFNTPDTYIQMKLDKNEMQSRQMHN